MKVKHVVKKLITPKRVAIVMAIVSLVSFTYKFTLGLLATSLVMIVAALPTLFVFVCKALYAKDMYKDQTYKLKTYFVMILVTIAFSILFIMFSIFKVGGIDITNKNRFTGWVGLIFIFFIIALFILSIINLKGAIDKKDLVYMGIKQISFVSALADAAMIQEFVYRVVLKYIPFPIPFMDITNKYFPLIVGAMMILVPLLMIKRFFKTTSEINDQLGRNKERSMLQIVGIVCAIEVVIFVVFQIIEMNFPISYSFENRVLPLYFIEMISIIIFGPALGTLFFCIGDIVKEYLTRIKKIIIRPKESSDEPKTKDSKSSV